MKETWNVSSVNGTLFYPEYYHAIPAVIIVGGLDAGVHESSAAMLTSEG